MKTIRNMLIFLSLVGIVTLPSKAEAVSVKWCGYWKTWYTDVTCGGTPCGEDLDTESGQVNRPARYAKAYLWKWNGMSYSSVWYGFLGSDGCSPLIDTLPNSQYLFTLETRVKRQNRQVLVQAMTETSWTGYAAFFENYLSTTETVPDPVNVYCSSITRAMNIAYLMGRFLARAVALDYEKGTTTYIATHNPPCGCCSFDRYDEELDAYLVCMGGWQVDWRKFMPIHEMGHVVANIESNNGPRHGEYTADITDAFAPPNFHCTCEGISSGSHCLGSREFIGSAQKEGFSHFISAATFNERDQSTNNGGFGYYKDVREGETNDDGDEIVNELFPPPYKTDVRGMISGSFVQWMYNECNPSGFKDLGAEWDWLGFFWNLWTYGSYKFSVSEINAVWDGIPFYRAYQCCIMSIPPSCTVFTSESMSCSFPFAVVQVGKKWNELSDWVYDHMSTDEYYHFRDRGINAKVNYYTP